MEVKAGYKKTEVGFIPVAWNCIQLKNLVDSTRGIRYGIVQPGPFDPKGRFMIRGQDYSKGWTDSAQVFKVSEKVETPFLNARVKFGDILITIVGASTGKVALVPKWLDGANLTQTTARIAIKNQNADAIYCLHILESWYGKNQVLNYIKGGAQPGLNCGDIEKFWIPLPPLPEQQAIANALSDADALIESLEQLIEKKRQIKQGVMQELLTGKRRLPGFEKERGFKQTEVGLIPGDWNYKAIGSSIDLLTGFPFPSLGYSKHGVRLLRGSNIKRGKTDWSDEITQYWPVQTRDLAKYSMQKGDLAISMDGSLVGRSYAQLDESDLPALLLQRVARIRSSSLDVNYLRQFVGSDKFIKYVDSVKTVTAIPHISPGDILKFKIPIPPTVLEQQAIANALSDADALIESLEQLIEKKRQIKHAMMQDLLTGKVRLV